jgi:hypothetical protein
MVESQKHYADERSQRQKDTYSLISFIQHSVKTKV